MSTLTLFSIIFIAFWHFSLLQLISSPSYITCMSWGVTILQRTFYHDAAVMIASSVLVVFQGRCHRSRLMMRVSDLVSTLTVDFDIFYSSHAQLTFLSRPIRASRKVMMCKIVIYRLWNLFWTPQSCWKSVQDRCPLMLSTGIFRQSFHVTKRYSVVYPYGNVFIDCFTRPFYPYTE